MFQTRAERNTEYIALRKEFENVVQSRNDMKEQFINVLQTQASYSKAAEYSKKRALSIVHHIAVLVRFSSYAYFKQIRYQKT